MTPLDQHDSSKHYVSQIIVFTLHGEGCSNSLGSGLLSISGLQA
jgi:hypothetical protein